MSVAIANGREKPWGYSQKPPRDPDKAVLRERIASIIHELLQEGRGTTPEGIRYRTRVPPSSAAVEEVRGYGDAAIPVLNEYLWSRDSAESELAMRFLGALGGKQIVQPLRRVIRRHPSPAVRSAALRWLTQAPWESAAPILREAADKDLDSGVRNTARELLTKHFPK